jgi:photosystem II stability/assembly factor-like uncharacterized protein
MPTDIDGLEVFGVSLFHKEKNVTRLSGVQIIFAQQTWCLSRRLLIGLLVICGMFSSLAQAEIWHSTTTSEMKDVAIAPNGLIWLTSKDGAVWVSDNIYGSSFTQIGASGFSRISVGPNGAVWAIGSNGTLWKFATGSWSETTASGMEDVAIAPDGKVWLVGENGTIWFSGDQGQKFTQIEASGFNRISAGPGGIVWAIGFNGMLWKFAAGSWTKTAASGAGDVAIAPNGLIWLAGKDGAIWSSPDGGVTFSQDEEARGIESIAAGRPGAWAVGFNGTLWRKLFSPQF